MRLRSKFIAPAAAAALLLAGPGISVSALAAETSSLSASYSIALAGIPIGRANAETRVDGTGYALTISGYTSGISRLVSDATAVMSSNGRIAGAGIVPSTFKMDTKESGLETRVRMRMNGGRVTALTASPDLADEPDRLPVTGRHKAGVVDPASAFVMPLAHPETADGNAACNRTVAVFDGWQRFDIRLSFKDKRQVESGSGYRGEVFVCGARYVPVAGHVPDQEAVRYMVDNKTMEVWLAPVPAMNMVVPYHILLGTRLGLLTVRATSFSPAGKASQAAAVD